MKKSIKEFRTKKSSKGITLISLVITVIIMLILAGVTITLSIDTGGLFSKVNDAATSWNAAVKEEENEINKYLGIIDTYNEKAIIRNAYQSVLANKISNADSTEIIGSELDDELKNKGASASGDNPITVIFENGHKYLIDGDGNITEYVPPKFEADYATGKILVEGKDIGLEIGDTIVGYDALSTATNFEAASEGSVNGYTYQSFRLKAGTGDDEQTVSYDLSSTGPGWKALGVDSEGNLLITTADIVRPIAVGDSTTGTLNYNLRGIAGLENAIKELNRLCGLYGQGELAKSVRSITMEDVNKVTSRDCNNVDGNGKKFTEKYTIPCGTEITFSWEEDSVTDGASSGYPYMSYTLNDNNVHRKIMRLSASFYYFDESTEKVVESAASTTPKIINQNPIKCTYYYYKKDKSDGSEKAKNMIFLNNSYLVASRYFTFFSNPASYNYEYGAYGMFRIAANQTSVKSIVSTYDGGGSDTATGGIRPVVTLKSSINVEKVGDSIYKVK